MGMTPRENAMAILEGRQPERYGDIMDAIKFVPDPIMAADRIPCDGEQHKDSWGTTCVWLPGAPGKHPYVTPENAAIHDVCEWKDELRVPSYEGLDWGAAREAAEAVDRSEYLVGFFSAQGLFERSHFLLGMEDALCDYLLEPEAMAGLLRAIADFKIGAIREAARQVKPDVVFFQDDWGSKQNLFLPPDTWRSLIKPLQMEISQAIHECGMLYIHHADCICEPIVEDMVDLGIDVWQGVIPENDIVAIQERTGHRLAMQGGIDGPSIDDEETDEEEIRAEVRRAVDAYCPGGRFFPGAPAPLLRKPNSDILVRELEAYGREWAEANPR